MAVLEKIVYRVLGRHVPLGYGTCYMIFSYRPHKTRKGYFVWRISHLITTVIAGSVGWEDYKTAEPAGKYYNKPLSPEDQIRMLAQETADE